MRKVGEGEERRLEALVSGLLADDSADFPIEQPGFVRTFLWPCYLHDLPEDRLGGLQSYALSAGSTAYYAKLLVQPYGCSLPPERLDEHQRIIRTGGFAEARQHLYRHSERYRIDLWRRGDWSNLDDVDDDVAFLEHLTVDEQGNWVLVFSHEGHGHLIASRRTSREILDLWQTTPRQELDGYWADHGYRTAVTDAFFNRVLRHARDGLWTPAA